MKQPGAEERPFFKEKLHETHTERHRKLREAGLTPHEIQRINGVLDWQLRILRAVLDILTEQGAPRLLQKTEQVNPELFEKRRAFSSIAQDIRKTLEADHTSDEAVDPLDMREIVREELMVFFESVLITHVRRPEHIEQDRIEVKAFLENIIHVLKSKAEAKSRDPKRPLLTLLPEDVSQEVKEVLQDAQKEGNHTLNEARVIDFLQRVTNLSLFHNERDKQNQRIRIFWEAARTIHRISRSNLELTIATPEEVETVINTFLKIALHLEEKLPVVFKEGSSHTPTQKILAELGERFHVVMHNHVTPIQDLQREYESVVKIYTNPRISLQNFIKEYESLRITILNLRQPPELEQVPSIARDSQQRFFLNAYSQEVIKMNNLVQSLQSTILGAQEEIAKLIPHLQNDPDPRFSEQVPVFQALHSHLQDLTGDLSRLNKITRNPALVAMSKGSVKRERMIPRLDIADQLLAKVQRPQLEEGIAILQNFRHGKGADEIKKEGFQDRLLSHMTMFRKQFLVPAALHLAYTDPRNSRSLAELIKDMFHEGIEEVVSLLKYTLQVKRRLDGLLTRKILNKEKGDGFYPPNFPSIEEHLRVAAEQGDTEESVLAAIRDLFQQLETDFIPSLHQLRGHEAIYNQDSTALNEEAVGVTRLLIQFDLHLKQLFQLRQQGSMTSFDQYSLFDFSEALQQIFKHLEKMQGQLFSMATNIQMRGEHELHKMSRKNFVLPTEDDEATENLITDDDL